MKLTPSTIEFISNIPKKGGWAALAARILWWHVFSCSCTLIYFVPSVFIWFWHFPEVPYVLWYDLIMYLIYLFGVLLKPRSRSADLPWCLMVGVTTPSSIFHVKKEQHLGSRQARWRPCMYTYICIYVHTYLYTYIPICMYIYIPMYVHIYMCLCIQISMYIHVSPRVYL